MTYVGQLFYIEMYREFKTIKKISCSSHHKLLEMDNSPSILNIKHNLVYEKEMERQMARRLVDGGGMDGSGSGPLMLLVMIIMSISIISMVIFSCGHDSDSTKPPRRRDGGDDGGGGDGDGGGGDGGGGGGGCGGGD